MARLTGNVLLAAIAGLLTLVTIEVGLRLLASSGRFATFFAQLQRAEPIFDKVNGTGLYYSHPYISYDLRPDYRSERAQINSSGFRGPPLETPKPAGRIRIFALGESTTYGIFNPQDETWPHHLEAQLRSKYAGLDVEVVNAGLVSATTAENLVRFLFRIVPLEPDVLVIYHGYNDLAARMFDGFSADYYHFRRTPTTERGVLSRLYIFKIASSALFPAARLVNTNLLEHTWRMDNLPKKDEDRIKNFYKTNASVFERNLDYIISLAKARRIPVVLITFGFDETKANWNPLMPSQLWGPGIEQNTRVVEALSEKYSLPLCRFRELAAKDRRVFDDSIHLTNYGNTVMANCILGALEESRDWIAAGKER